MNLENNLESYWDNIYKSKNSDQMSWTQPVPKVSLDLIDSFNLPKTAKIIDIGGGDSTLVDNLLDNGFENITVLDISESAINKAKARLGIKANKVTWIVSDILNFTPNDTYDIWHDRAAFHFLTNMEQVKRYIDIASQSTHKYMTIGTFSENGPTKCSGLDIQQYSEDTMSSVMNNHFEKVRCISNVHHTPFNTTQNFLFCSFRSKYYNSNLPI